MDDRNNTAVPDQPAADPAVSLSPQATAGAMTTADAVEIAQTCQIAGRTDLIAGFLEAHASPAKVRSQLLSAQAEASPEIVSRIQPDGVVLAANAGHPASPHNPLIQAIKSRLGTQ